MKQAVQSPVENHGNSLYRMYPAISESDWRADCPNVEKVKEGATCSLRY
jgi:hypothetical protein